MIMGRLTYDSIGRPLPGRKTIVVSQSKPDLREGVSLVSSLEDAQRLGEKLAAEMGVDELMVVGGAKIYQQLLPRVSRLYVTEVHTFLEGDAHFPGIELQNWTEVDRVRCSSESTQGLDYSFVTYDRK
jgi:dihydrofolate reductase